MKKLTPKIILPFIGGMAVLLLLGATIVPTFFSNGIKVDNGINLETGTYSGNGSGLTNLFQKVQLVHNGAATTFSDPAVAWSNSVTGDTIQIGPGVFYVSNWFKCPTNGVVIGAGRGATVLVSCYTNSAPTPLIACSDNGYVGSMTISNLYGDPSPSGIFAACLGMHFQATGPYTNFVGNDLVLWGGSDTFYNRRTNGNPSATFFNSEFHGPWDIVTAFSGGTHSYKFYDCVFDHKAVVTHANANDVFVDDSGTTLQLLMVRCSLSMSNGIQNGYFLNIALGSASSTANFVDCNFTNSVPSPSTPAFSLGSCGVRFEGCTGLQPYEIDNNGIVDPSAVSWGTNVVSKITFGGDSVTTAPSLQPNADFTALVLDSKLAVTGTGAGTLSFENSTGTKTNAGYDGTDFFGSGGGLSNLNATLISSGTIPSARLPDPMTNGTIYATALNATTITGNAAGMSNMPFAQLNFGGLVTANFTSVVCGYLKFTNAGTIYSLVVSTNLP